RGDDDGVEMVRLWKGVRDGGWRVVASDIGDRIDWVTGNIFEVRQKSFPVVVVAGGGRGGGRRVVMMMVLRWFDCGRGWRWWVARGGE
nr:hypothetical protein [Tanacetum cinerariifolium]